MLLPEKIDRQRPCMRSWCAFTLSGVLAVAVLVSCFGLSLAEDAKNPTTPTAAADVKMLRKKLAEALKNGQDDEAQRLFEQIEKALKGESEPALEPKKPAEPAKPVDPPVVKPEPPMPPEVRPVPPMRPLPGQGDFRNQYDRQLKEFDEMIKNLDDPEARQQLEKARDEFRKAMEDGIKQSDKLREQLRKIPGVQFPGGGIFPGVFPGGNGALPFPAIELDLRPLDQARLGFGAINRPVGQLRFGVTVERPSAVLIEQLDLPPNTGLVISEVFPGTAAEKAGIKKNDILLQIGGQDVPSEMARLQAILANWKNAEKVDATVVRKGKKEKIMGIELPDPRKIGGVTTRMSVQVNGRNIMMSTSQDGVDITVVGEMVEGKWTPTKIIVKDGQETVETDTVEKLPEKYRPAAENLTSAFRTRFGRRAQQ